MHQGLIIIIVMLSLNEPLLSLYIIIDIFMFLL